MPNHPSQSVDRVLEALRAGVPGAFDEIFPLVYDELRRVAAGLNGRPRKTLGWKTPAEALDQLLSTLPTAGGVATTP